MLKLAINQTINEEQITNNLVEFAAHWQRFLMAAEPKLKPLVFSFNAEQKQQLLQALQETNQEKLDDHEEKTNEQWLENRSEEQQKQLKEWFGKLTQAQKTQVKTMSQGFRQSFLPWISYRQHWAKQFSELLNGDLPEHQFQREFYRLFVNGRNLRSDEFNAITKHNNQVFAKIFVYMATNATDKQGKRINKKINKVIRDLEYLINDE